MGNVGKREVLPSRRIVSTRAYVIICHEFLILLQLALEYERHQVELLEHHTQRGTHDVLLIDPGPPSHDISLLRELKGTSSIILTTHDEYRWLCEQHHLPLLQKPFHLKELVELVHAVGTRASELASCEEPVHVQPVSDGNLLSAP